MKPIEFFRDRNGNPQARGSDAQLATFLMTDCQASVGVIDELLSRLNGDEPTGEFTGNGHHIEINGARIGLEPLHGDVSDNEPKRYLSTVYFRETVQQWRAFVARDHEAG